MATCDTDVVSAKYGSPRGRTVPVPTLPVCLPLPLINPPGTAETPRKGAVGVSGAGGDSASSSPLGAGRSHQGAPEERWSAAAGGGSGQRPPPLLLLGDSGWFAARGNKSPFPRSVLRVNYITCLSALPFRVTGCVSLGLSSLTITR